MKADEMMQAGSPHHNQGSAFSQQNEEAR